MSASTLCVHHNTSQLHASLPFVDTCFYLWSIVKVAVVNTKTYSYINGSIAFIFSVKICLAVKRNANNKFKCGRMGHGDEVLRFYKNCAI